MCLVDSLCVGIEEIGKRSASNCILLGACWLFYLDKQVEMVWKETIGESVVDRFDVFPVEVEEIEIITFFKEYGLAIYAAIIDMVNHPRL